MSRPSSRLSCENGMEKMGKDVVRIIMIMEMEMMIIMMVMVMRMIGMIRTVKFEHEEDCHVGRMGWRRWEKMW